MTYIAKGDSTFDLSDQELDHLFSEGLAKALSDKAKTGTVLILPPDGTRFHSRAGYFTDLAYRELKDRLGAVMPALGTHFPMTKENLQRMFPKIPLNKFRVHNWRNEIVELGRLSADWIENISKGTVCYDWPVQVNKALRDGGFSMILSIGQVVPHEVVGMANHTKNVFVGTGGKEAINKSHFVGACYGMEKIMGRIDTPVRTMFDEGYNRFSNLLPPILWVLTVVSARSEIESADKGKPKGSLAVRGLYIGFGRECFEMASKLSQEVNVNILDEPIKKAVVYLEPEEFRSTWLGNKAIYRTRMAMEDNGELLILAPGLETFGEDPGNDILIRKYGYKPSKAIQEKVKNDPELAHSLGVAAHLIHGSSEGKFHITYCTGQGISKEEIESVGYDYGDLKSAMLRYDIEKLNLGWNTMPDGEKIFFVSNPALGLWAEKKRFCGI